MKTRFFLSFLFILFLGINFSACSNDDDSTESSFEAGKTVGIKFYEAYNAYKKTENTIAKTSHATTMLDCYNQYKSNSSDAKWKSGFLAGATNFDSSKYDSLAELLSKDFSLNNIVDIVSSLTEILK